MAEIVDRIFSRCWEFTPDGRVVVHPGDVLERLLLFDAYIIDSNLLQELPPLVHAFGADAVARLLTSELVGLRCEAISVAQVAQTDMRFTAAQTAVRPIGYFRFSSVRNAQTPEHYTDYIEAAFENLDWGLVSKKDQAKVLTAVVMKLRSSPAGTGLKALSQLNADLVANHPSLNVALALHLSRQLKTTVAPSDFRAKWHYLGNDEFRAETNIGAKFGLTPGEVHKSLEHAALAVGGLNQRFELMEVNEAVTGFREQELPMLESRLSVVEKALRPERHLERFERVARVLNLPDLREAAVDRRIDLDRFLEVRKTEEWEQFRAWLRRSDSLTDDQIRELARDIRARLAPTIGTLPGKLVRFVATTAIGAAGPIAGAGVWLRC